MNHRLSDQIQALKYGFESKLFDGILYCTDAQRLSKSRLQLMPNGFGFPFSQTLIQADDLVLFMKAGADTNAGAQKIVELIVHFDFFIPIGQTYQQVRLDIPIPNLVQSNFPGGYRVDIPESALGATAFGFSYTIIEPTPPAHLAGKTGIFLYEILLPNSVWIS
jgi:hypothetical protein